jgi:hypothetical protein
MAFNSESNSVASATTWGSVLSINALFRMSSSSSMIAKCFLSTHVSMIVILFKLSSGLIVAIMDHGKYGIKDP